MGNQESVPVRTEEPPGRHLFQEDGNQGTASLISWVQSLSWKGGGGKPTCVMVFVTQICLQPDEEDSIAWAALGTLWESCLTFSC